jgi:hypothetical protein
MSRKTTGGGAARAASDRPVEQCIALIDYDALNSDEISFRAGDVINVTGKGSASGFWEGYVAVPAFPAMAVVDAGSDNEREASLSVPSAHHQQPQQQQQLHGLFPNCLVTSNMRFKASMANYIFQNVALCLYTYEATGEGEMSLAPGDVITAVRPSASPGWWYGVKSPGPAWTGPPTDAREAAPPTRPSPRFADPSARDNTATRQELLFPTNFVTCDVVLIAFNFVGRQAHELSCRSGDVVQVHRRWNDGWWEGSLRDRRGIFPSNYSVPNISSTSPPLFCARCRSVYPSNLFQSTCATCAAEKRLEDIMLQSLEAYVRGDVATYDLFAGIQIGPLDGVDGAGGAATVDSLKAAASSADAMSAGSSSSRQKAKVRAGESADDGARPTAFSPVRDDHRTSFEGDEDWPEGASSSRPRATLLTAKDLADLASNRVKLME